MARDETPVSYGGARLRLYVVITTEPSHQCSLIHWQIALALA
jgi:hypothetical protein